MRRPTRRSWIAIGASAAAVVLGVPLLMLAALQAGAADGLVKGLLSAKLGHPVSFRALKTTLASGASHMVFSDIAIADPPRFGRGVLVRARTLDLQLKLLPLLAGRLEARRITLVDPIVQLRRKGPGNDNWTFGKGGASSFLAYTQRLEITGGRVSMDDPRRHLSLQGAVSHDPADAAWPLHLSGGGVLNDAPFTVEARGAPLNARRPGAAYPVRVAMVDGDTHVQMIGSTQKPFDFSGFDIDFSARGPNLADLVYLFNLLAPNSPPFVATAHMRKDGRELHATDIKAKIGDSDLSGEIVSDHDRPRRLITGTLRSQRLAAGDLKAMLSSIPEHAVTRSTPGRPAQGHTPSGRVFSPSPFSLARLQHNDTRLDYAAQTVTGYGLPVRDAALKLEITAGRLKLAPLSFRTARGRVDAAFTLDTAQPVPLVALTAKVRGAQVASLSRGKGGFSGRLDADVDMRGRGVSFAAAAAAADGKASLRVSGGALPKLDAEALQGDLFGMVGAALGGGKAKAPLRCAVADFTASNGIMRATRLAVGAGDGLATGGGQIDLKREQLDLALRATGRGDRPAVQLKTPIVLSGPFDKPKVDTKLSKASLSFGGLFGALAKPFKGDTAKAPAAPAC